MDMGHMSDVETNTQSESKIKADKKVTEVHSCKCLYDFAVLHGDKEKELAEKFFLVLEKKYELKGYHCKRDFVLGVLKQRQLVKSWQASSFILELTSVSSMKDKIFQKYRSIAHEVENKSTTSNHPEVLPIYVDIPPKEQRALSTRVGRSFSDTDLFWDELAAHILNNHSCLSASSDSCIDANKNESSSETQLELSNNNEPSKETLPVKSRKKHKLFRGLLKPKNKKLNRKLKRVSSYPKKSNKRKRKSKKSLKSLRRLMICVPARSEDSSGCSPAENGLPITDFHIADAASAEMMEHSFRGNASRMNSAEHDR